MKIIFLEGENLGEDMVFTPFLHLGEVTIYPSTSEKEMPERVKDADIIVANKLPMCEETLKDAKNLKLVCLTATGINNLDGEYLKKRGIHVPLIPGSSLYYTMSAAVSGNTREISEYGSLTLQYALSIAAGISIVWTFCSIWRRYQTMNYIKKHSD